MIVYLYSFLMFLKILNASHSKKFVFINLLNCVKTRLAKSIHYLNKKILNESAIGTHIHQCYCNNKDNF